MLKPSYIGAMALYAFAGTAFAAVPIAIPEIDEARRAELEALARDPAIIDAQVQAVAENQQWLEGLLCDAMKPHQSPGIRIAAVGAMSRMEDLTDELGEYRCDGAGDKAGLAMEDVARQAMRDGWNTPAVLLDVYKRYCVGDAATDWCDAEAVRIQLKKLEPGNAFFTLLPLMDRPFKSLDTDYTEAEIDNLLLAAAADTQFNMHQGDFAYAGYQAAADYLIRHPAPALPEVLRQAQEKSGIKTPEDRAVAPATMLMLRGHHDLPGWGNIDKSCAVRITNTESRVAAACRSIAETMKSSPSELAFRFGRAMLNEWERKLSGTTREQAREKRNRNARLSNIANACASPRTLNAMLFNPDQFMSDEYVRYLKDLQDNGERPALQRLAQREYDAHPDWYVIDPGRCDNIWSLEIAAQDDLIELADLESWPDAIRAFADQL